MADFRPTVFFDSKGPDGNIFALIGKVSRLLDKDGRNDLKRIYQADSYEEALAIIREHVNLIDMSREY